MMGMAYAGYGCTIQTLFVGDSAGKWIISNISLSLEFAELL